jgi:cytochrome P450
VTSPADLPMFAPEWSDFLDHGEALLLEHARGCPMSRTPFGVDVYRRDDVNAALRDRTIEARVTLALMAQGVTSGQLFDTMNASILNQNGPDHLRERSLVGKAFTPASVERVRPVMRTIAAELIDTFAARGHCEFMEDFANHFPVQVIATMLGVPVEDRHTFRQWLDTITFALSSVAASNRDEIELAQIALAEYVEDMVSRRRDDPGDDLVTALLAAEEAGDRFTHDEVRRMIISLLFAGHDTTRNQLGRALVTFSEHPDQWAWLAEHPESAPQAVDECLRYCPSVGGVAPRLATAPVTLGGVDIPAGTILRLATVTASRDPHYYDEPDRFDITVARPVAALTFGGGPHLCLGINLARAEMAEALVLLSQRLRDLAPDGPATFPPQVGIYGPSMVPLRFTPTA